MEIRVLGPVAVYADGAPIPLGPRKRRYLPCLDDARPMTTERGDENGS